MTRRQLREAGRLLKPWPTLTRAMSSPRIPDAQSRGRTGARFTRSCSAQAAGLQGLRQAAARALAGCPTAARSPSSRDPQLSAVNIASARTTRGDDESSVMRCDWTRARLQGLPCCRPSAWHMLLCAGRRFRTPHVLESRAHPQAKTDYVTVVLRKGLSPSHLLAVPPVLLARTFASRPGGEMVSAPQVYDAHCGSAETIRTVGGPRFPCDPRAFASFSAQNSGARPPLPWRQGGPAPCFNFSAFALAAASSTRL